ncbi:hypothetical protein T265_04921 [Opisthorchis viverrini]|uniref:Uncharacterized protein n=1 Tax=Opisthorchis viverrini TaxID=6198 RepID=A0A074ZXZ5_OPIVI|nr:hypothetical protein T265_04921 [Opisthorchis viverrini]KER28160.1 hypothetical protein T265_04921 [Opisthorchis viverrini]
MIFEISQYIFIEETTHKVAERLLSMSFQQPLKYQCSITGDDDDPRYEQTSRIPQTTLGIENYTHSQINLVFTRD